MHPAELARYGSLFRNEKRAVVICLRFRDLAFHNVSGKYRQAADPLVAIDEVNKYLASQKRKEQRHQV
jgi:hypothetical protein